MQVVVQIATGRVQSRTVVEAESVQDVISRVHFAMRDNEPLVFSKEGVIIRMDQACAVQVMPLEDFEREMARQRAQQQAQMHAPQLMVPAGMMGNSGGNRGGAAS